MRPCLEKIDLWTPNARVLEPRLVMQNEIPTQGRKDFQQTHQGNIALGVGVFLPSLSQDEYPQDTEAVRELGEKDEGEEYPWAMGLTIFL